MIPVDQLADALDGIADRLARRVERLRALVGTLDHNTIPDDIHAEAGLIAVIARDLRKDEVVPLTALEPAPVYFHMRARE